MTTAREKKEYDDRRFLSDAGWSVSKKDNVSMHTGAETLQHFIGKALAAYRLNEVGYRIDSEVSHKSGNAVDVLAYGCKGRDPIGVEVETGLNDDKRAEKIDKYVHNGRLSDVFFIEATEVPANIIDGYEWVKEQIL
jgi:hypothetical protein